MEYKKYVKFILVTGDLHNFKEGYEKAKIFLEKLLVFFNLTKKDILNLLNTNHFEDCKHLNPTGENCDILFKNAIQFAYNQKEKGEK